MDLPRDAEARLLEATVKRINAAALGLHAPPAGRLTEAAFQAMVIDLARATGWRVAHFAPARTKRGWVTPVRADGKGWVDLVLVRERLVHAELKSDRGRPRPEQVAWVAALRAAGAEVYVWRPRDWGHIVQALAGEG